MKKTITARQIHRLRRHFAGALVIASVSGGKDSGAMSLALKECEIEHERIFQNTRWEKHDKNSSTYDYVVGELQAGLGPITVLNPPHGMAALVLKKGMFPSRKFRFCTEELKMFPAQRHFERRMAESGRPIVSVVGIRWAESEDRSRMREWEPWTWKAHSDGAPTDVDVWRPLLRWTVDDVIAIHKRHGLRPNPLYLEGASRVGCWPCIFARKDEIRRIAETDPERINLIRRLEERVTRRAAARAAASGEALRKTPAFFQSPFPDRELVSCEDCEGRGEICYDDGDQLVMPCARCEGTGKRQKKVGTPMAIDDVVTWSKTSHGGRQVELFAAPASDEGCMRWGLCETRESPDWKKTK